MRGIGQGWVPGKPECDFWTARLGEEATLAGHCRSRSRLEGRGRKVLGGQEMRWYLLDVVFNPDPCRSSMCTRYGLLTRNSPS